MNDDCDKKYTEYKSKKNLHFGCASLLISSLFLPAIPAEMTQQVSAQIKIALTIK